jgi:E3 ubiquitin-protein ligase RAD18
MVSFINPIAGQTDGLDETECPLCQAKMPVGEIPKHIDRQCPPVKPKSKTAHSGNQKSDWKKVFSGAGSGKTKESVYLS